MSNPYEGVKRFTSESGDVAEDPEDVTHLRCGRDGEVHFHIVQWDEPEDGKWIRTPDSDLVNLYSMV